MPRLLGNPRRRPRARRITNTTPRAPTRVTIAPAAAPLMMQSQPGTWDPMTMDTAPMSAPRRDRAVTFRRTYSITILSANTGVTANGFSFSLSNLPNYTEFTSLYDQYRILQASVSFLPYANSSSSGSVTGSFPGIIASAIDYDDASLPGTTDLQQYESYKRNPAFLEFVRTIKPRVAIATYNGSTFTGYANQYAPWIDANSPNVPHYGLKTVIFNSTYTTSTPVYEVEVQLTFQVRSAH